MAEQYVWPLTPVSVSTGDLAQETTLQDVLTELEAVNVSTTSLAAEDFATETTLAALAAEDFATQTTLAALNAKVAAADTGNVVIASSVLPTGAASESTLSDVLTEVEEINTQVTGMNTEISAINNRLAGSLAPVAYDEIVQTYVGATTNLDTVVYKLASVTVKTLTFSYDGSNRLSGVVAT
jgi:hypothetical protein